MPMTSSQSMMKRRRSRWLRLAISAVMLCAAPARGQELAAAQLTDEHVQKAVAALVEALYARKDGHRAWEPEKVPAGDSTRQGGGYTSLVMLAMLYAGQSYQEPRLRDAVEYLERFSMEGTYAVSMRNQVWARLPPKFADRMTNDTQWLLEGFSEQAAGWDYEQNPRARRQDNSIRQFGALALWEAAKRGLRIEPRYWQRLEDGYLNMQLADGGWNYTGEGPATGSMTAAGLATLFITQDLLHAQEALKVGVEKASRQRTAIENGLKWMDANFSPTENPGKNTWFYYYLYGVERVGLASGYKTFGGKDWYREGAAEIIRRLLKWDESSRSFTVHQNTWGSGRAAKIRTDDLAFGLMFLSRGRVPVAVNKLEFSGEWNNRPRDVANLAGFLRETSETDVNWQIVKMADGPESWLDAPMVYVASHESLPFVKALRDGDFDIDGWVKQAKEFIRRRAAGEVAMDAAPPQRPASAELDALRRYLDLGGTLLAIAEGGGRPFARSVEEAGLLMYPQYEWRDLPETHWAYTLHTPLKSRRPPLRSLSNGVRDLIVLAPSGDLSAALQVNDIEKRQSDFNALANVYFYASELNQPRPRLEKHAEYAAAATAAGAGSVVIVRALHEGNWKPEPQALNVFAAWLRDSRGINLSIADHPLTGIGELQPRPALVVVSGIERHQFSDAQQQAIRAYVDAGGVILFETPGGAKMSEFTASAEAMCAELFKRPVESPGQSRVLTGAGLPRAVDCTRVEYRPFALQVFGSRETTPRLQAMSVAAGRQPQIFFSREDISNGLLNQPVWGVIGYSAVSARHLLANILQHAMAGAG
jgi:hypothetical protein